MDTYEKKYNEALKDMKAIYPNLKGDAKLAMEHAFPELAESEDEKTRKGLIDFVNHYRHNTDLTSEQAEWCKKALTWLEKQKEQKPITESKRLANEVIEYLTRCGYSPVLKDDSEKEHFHIDIPRHEDDFWHSEEYKHCRSVLGEYYMEGDYGGDIYTLYIWRSKKEQKPREIEWEDAETLAYIRDILKKYFLRSEEFEDIDKWLTEHYIEQKPAEWSEEDSLHLTNAVLSAEKEWGTESCTAKWLKLLPERFNLQPKQEWNTHDKAIVNSIVCCLDGQFVTEAARKLALEWFNKHRRDFLNSPSWKPSEEQMNALNALNCHGNLSYIGQQNQLISLYNDLKKLKGGVAPMREVDE